MTPNADAAGPRRSPQLPSETSLGLALRGASQRIGHGFSACDGDYRNPAWLGSLSDYTVVSNLGLLPSSRVTMLS